MNYSDFFIAIYTHECKSYCDKQFFEHLFNTDLREATVNIVDNSIGMNYFNNLNLLIDGIKPKGHTFINHIDVDRNNPHTQFLRNVCESVNYLRDIFLKTKCLYFVILESDVLPPERWLHFFIETLSFADIIGGIYYAGWHGQDMFDAPGIIRMVTHALSGCTLYKREVIEKIPFRCDLSNPAAFPDAFMSMDALNAGYKLVDYSSINCQHIFKGGMDRGHADIR